MVNQNTRLGDGDVQKKHSFMFQKCKGEEIMVHLQAGRLSSIDMKIEEDPRTDPRIAEAISLDIMPIRGSSKHL